jgi:hypothetical protein
MGLPLLGRCPHPDCSEDRIANLTDKAYLEQKHDLLRSYITAALRHG